jgi:hypothetical protein
MIRPSGTATDDAIVGGARHGGITRGAEFEDPYHHSDWRPVTLEPFELKDRMLRKACGSFVLRQLEYDLR